MSKIIFLADDPGDEQARSRNERTFSNPFAINSVASWLEMQFRNVINMVISCQGLSPLSTRTADCKTKLAGSQVEPRLSARSGADFRKRNMRATIFFLND